MHGIRAKGISNVVIFLIGSLSISLTLSAQSYTIFMIGDSTMSDKPDPDNNPERGWGQMLPQYLPDHVTVANRAMNGRSSRSFIAEGRWQQVLKNIKRGDLVFIQFGHNDQKVKDPKRYTNPYTAYRNNLVKYVLESREVGATPILFTSIVRRKFNNHGTLIDTHGEYPLVVRLVAAEYNVPLVDLQYKTEKMEESLGQEKSKNLHLHYEPGEHPYYPKGKSDNTHLSDYGASKIAKMVQEELKVQGLLD